MAAHDSEELAPWRALYRYKHGVNIVCRRVEHRESELISFSVWRNSGIDKSSSVGNVSNAIVPSAQVISQKSNLEDRRNEPKKHTEDGKAVFVPVKKFSDLHRRLHPSPPEEDRRAIPVHAGSQ